MTDIDLGPERYWEDVQVGQQLAGFSMHLGWTSMALQVSGSQDWNIVHHDLDYARDSGHDAPFYNTGWTSAMLARLLTDWVGPTGWVHRIEFQMRKMNRLRDTVHARGKVTGKHVDETGSHFVEVDIWLENDRDGVATPGTAVVKLPTRATP
jgi:acyl dehydratase